MTQGIIIQNMNTVPCLDQMLLVRLKFADRQTKSAKTICSQSFDARASIKTTVCANWSGHTDGKISSIHKTGLHYNLAVSTKQCVSTTYFSLLLFSLISSNTCKAVRKPSEMWLWHSPQPPINLKVKCNPFTRCCFQV